MKLKFFKTLAIACVLCMAFATLTAFAADNAVTTITSYTYGSDADMTIETTVGDVKVGDEITYYVENAGKIVYIDQATAEAETVGFTFTAAKNDVLTAVAKNGSDKGYTFPTFTFAEGCNYLSKGTPTVTKGTDWGVKNTAYGDETGYIFQGNVTGAVTAYGIKIGDVELKAQGCDEAGNFVIVVENMTEAEFNAATIVEFAR